jgi:hypothetical protein
MKSLVKALSIACIAGTLAAQSSFAGLSLGSGAAQNGQAFVSRLAYKYLSNPLKFKASPTRTADTAGTVFLLGFALCGVELLRRKLQPAY